MNEPRPDSDSSNRHFSLRRYLLGLVLRLMLLLVAYILSAGPMYWKIYEAYHLNGSPFIAKLYLPLVLAYEHCEPLREFLDWYIGFWIL